MNFQEMSLVEGMIAKTDIFLLEVRDDRGIFAGLHPTLVEFLEYLPEKPTPPPPYLPLIDRLEIDPRKYPTQAEIFPKMEEVFPLLSKRTEDFKLQIQEKYLEIAKERYQLLEGLINQNLGLEMRIEEKPVLPSYTMQIMARWAYNFPHTMSYAPVQTLINPLLNQAWLECPTLRSRMASAQRAQMGLANMEILALNQIKLHQHLLIYTQQISSGDKQYLWREGKEEAEFLRLMHKDQEALIKEAGLTLETIDYPERSIHR
ncbi:hypothetical protein [Helicobacter suis]|uniref:hypothetical protein n=1 Tax=Helicobacter suis TaxID=104628 RepID=UPI0013D51ABB|nr:hypothetical protein [Helicobacter suis]